MDHQSSQWYKHSSFDSFWKNYNFANELLRKQGFTPVPLNIDNVSSTDKLEVCEEGNVCEEEEECDIKEAEEEISEEYLSFLMETRRHQQERDRKRQEKEKREQEVHYTDISTIVRFTTLGEVPKSNTESEQSGYKRKQELLELYGERATEIECLEAEMQMNFNQFCDKYNPKLWPILCRF